MDRSMTTGSGKAAAAARPLPPGAIYLGDGSCSFRVWAPSARELSVDLYSPSPRAIALSPADSGYWQAVAHEVPPGASYKFHFGDGRSFADPASRLQLDGVHGPSRVVDPAFSWTDSHWHSLAIEDYVLYEMHVGTFTPEGTFDAAIDHLPYLKELGVTAIEVMPVAQFPGTRNWGYDGVYPFAVQNSYGGPGGFKRFVDAAHGLGLAVVLDVVYNHLGPEGNYLGQFGPYFTDRYQTPWGQAINFDGNGSEAVREYFVENALYWVRDFHIDGLRLDAVHAIHDASDRHILADIADAVHACGRELRRTINVIAESDLNEVRIVLAGELGGYGLDAQWSDDFHHALHAVFTGERSGYYEDFGRMEDLAKALSSGFVYSGQYSTYRGRCHGTDCTDIPGRAFVVCAQNHDQIGNRMMGERLSHLIAIDDLKLAAGILLLSPFVPLMFMGQEYAETAPFLYFVSHTDRQLVAAVREGRKREFEAFAWRGEIPDAQDENTFARSKLNHDLRASGWHAVVLDWYRTLITMRRREPALARLDRERTTVELVGDGHALLMRRWSAGQEVLAVFNIGEGSRRLTVDGEAGRWTKLLDSAEERWLGRGSPVPALIESEGTIEITVEPKQCLVLASVRERSAFSGETAPAG
jgi:maltooligosyltrehalose trehalohydrolase